jgi:hypothetical protein
MTNKQVYTVSDDVIARIIQIVQEAFLTGIDCLDIMRQIELEVSDDDAAVLTLPQAYIRRVAEGYVRMAEHAEELKNNKSNEKTFTFDVEG